MQAPTGRHLLRGFAIIGICAGITILIGVFNIWLGILAMPIMYGISESLLSE